MALTKTKGTTKTKATPTTTAIPMTMIGIMILEAILINSDSDQQPVKEKSNKMATIQLFWIISKDPSIFADMPLRELQLSSFLK